MSEEKKYGYEEFLKERDNPNRPLGVKSVVSPIIKNNEPVNKQDGIGRIICITLVTFPFVIILFSFLINMAETQIREKPQTVKNVKIQLHSKLDAFTITQDFVEANLKCPRTAKWPWISYSKVTVHLGNGCYQISSYLDAQNGFGAMVRINFVCVVEHISGSNWRLIKLLM